MWECTAENGECITCTRGIVCASHDVRFVVWHSVRVAFPRLWMEHNTWWVIFHFVIGLAQVGLARFAPFLHSYLKTCRNWICCTSHGYIVHTALLQYTTRRHVPDERNPQPHRCENRRTVFVTCSELHVDHVVCVVQQLSVSCEACFWWLCNDAGIFSRRFVLQLHV
jgi:hypothetical protein